VDGLTQLARDALMKSHYNSVEKISKTAPALFLNFTNGDLQLAENLVSGAREYMDALEELAKKLNTDKEKEKTEEETSGETPAPGSDKAQEISAPEESSNKNNNAEEGQ
jgi:Ulp1 family protease